MSKCKQETKGSRPQPVTPATTLGLGFGFCMSFQGVQTANPRLWLKSLVSLPFAFKPCSTSMLPNSPPGA